MEIAVTHSQPIEQSYSYDCHKTEQIEINNHIEEGLAEPRRGRMNGTNTNLAQVSLGLLCWCPMSDAHFELYN